VWCGLLRRINKIALPSNIEHHVKLENLYVEQENMEFKQHGLERISENKTAYTPHYFISTCILSKFSYVNQQVK